ncbi:hypothetical protein U1Q18_038023, partial [Sarracenia purpurea var. burkii]
VLHMEYTFWETHSFEDKCVVPVVRIDERMVLATSFGRKVWLLLSLLFIRMMSASLVSSAMGSGYLWLVSIKFGSVVSDGYSLAQFCIRESGRLISNWYTDYDSEW